MKTQRVFIRDSQIVHAWELLKEHLKPAGDYFVYDDEWSDERVAREVSTETHPINAKHIKTRREDEWKMPLRPKGMPPGPDELIRELRERLDEQDKRIKALEEEAAARSDLTQLIEEARKVYRDKGLGKKQEALL